MPSNSILNIKKDGEWVEIPYLKGEDGYSPTATVVKDGNKSTLTVTDKNGTTTVDILDGNDGVTPNLTIGTVETLPSGNDATATITGDKENPVLNLGIPKGADGKGGSGGSGEENKINSISINGVNVSPDVNKNVDIIVPTVTNDLTDDLKSSYDDAVTAKHTHDNKSVIDKFSVSDSGTLLFDGSEIKGTGSAGKSAYEIAVDNGFVGTETEWLESLKGSDGTTPHIDESTKNWFIGNTDTGILAQGTNGKDGKSISTITKDDNDNIIVTFTDGTTQNIGKLSVDIQGDFLASDGFGNLRYYNGHFQYYDESSSTWVDTSVTPSNVYIMNMIPQPMQKIMAVYDTKLCKYKLKWQEPYDTVIDGQVACILDKVIIRRKLNSVPTNETDGDLVIEVKRKDFNSHKNEYFIDQALTPNNGDIYYYKAFPVSTTGFYNYSTMNETSGIVAKDYVLYGFKLDQNESDPASMITYIEDNKDFESAHMDYTADTFKYGDWADAWFIKNLKPCMLKYDGTVDYELDKDDYSKKLDGTPSDVANTSYDGNAMIGFPKVYWKVVDNGDNTANIYFSDKKVDSSFKCWSHLDNNSKEIDYCYMPIFNGSLVDGKLRSLSGRTPIASKTASDEINYAKANNISSDVIWYTELINDRMFVDLLLLLIGKSADTQAVFGNGHHTGGTSASDLISSGSMDKKGLFYGTNGSWKGVKVFGMEHWWGNQWRRIGGWINDKGTQKIKMTYGQSDGSTTDGYNLDGSGYIAIASSTPSGTNSGYISKMLITENGLIPTAASGSATTYYCDGLWFNNSQVTYTHVGSGSCDGFKAGAFATSLFHPDSSVFWYTGAALSCKPLATT